LMVLSAAVCPVCNFCLIFVPGGHYDEPEILPYEILLICSIDADVIQSGIVEVAEKQLSGCSTVRLRFIRHDFEWPNALVPEELSHEFQCGPFV